MSTRDWSEAYFVEESSVHGREGFSVFGDAPVAADPVKVAEAAYHKALAAKEAAVAAVTPSVPALSPKVEAWIMDNEVAYEGRRSAPAWVRSAVAAYEAATKAATEAGIEAFMESDEAEEILANLVAAKAALDAAIKAKAAAEAAEAAAKEAESKELRSIRGWILVSGRSVALEAAIKSGRPTWNGDVGTVKDDMVVTVAQALKITHPRNPDRFIPSAIAVYDEATILDIGFGSDLNTLSARMAG